MIKALKWIKADAAISEMDEIDELRKLASTLAEPPPTTFTTT